MNLSRHVFLAPGGWVGIKKRPPQIHVKTLLLFYFFMNDMFIIFVGAYFGVILLGVILGIFILLKVDAVMIVPEKVAAKLQEDWDFANCEHKRKFVGHLNNRYIEKCDDCGELLVEEYAKTLSKYA